LNINFETILDNSKNNKNQDLIVSRKKGLNYGDLLDAYKKINLASIECGDVVALIGDYTPETIAYLFRLIDKKCIVVPLTQDTSKEHDYFFENAYVDWVIENNKIMRNQKINNNSHQLIEDLKKTKQAGLILFSTGTSGKPKAILHNLTPFFERYLNANKNLTTLSFLLFDHIGGLNTFFYSFFAGSKIIFPQERSPEYIWRLIEEENVELLPTSPTFLRLSKASVDFDKLNLSDLKLITFGTELMEQDLLDWYVDKFKNIEFRQTYGLTELGILKIKNEKPKSLFISIGGDSKYRIIDNILHIKAEFPMLGYLNSDNPFDDDGYYNTKDIVVQNGEYFKITGRETDIVNIGGIKINPHDLEAYLLKNKKIKEVVAYGVKNNILGQTINLDINLIEGEVLSKEEIIKYILDKFPPIYRPTGINLVEGKQYNHRYKKFRRHE
jgi:long-chain acyl-CoA synthetase